MNEANQVSWSSQKCATCASPIYGPRPSLTKLRSFKWACEEAQPGLEFSRCRAWEHQRHSHIDGRPKAMGDDREDERLRVSAKSRANDASLRSGLLYCQSCAKELRSIHVLCQPQRWLRMLRHKLEHFLEDTSPCRSDAAAHASFENGTLDPW